VISPPLLTLDIPQCAVSEYFLEIIEARLISGASISPSAAR
jgi:hypothetical protein